MLLHRLLAEAGLTASEPLKNREIGGVCAHSDAVKKGDLFVAIRGLCADGNAYVEKALQKGAVFVVSEREILGVPSLRVENARAAYAALLDAFLGHPAAGMRLIGVTGTNGKTSVSSIIYHVLQAQGRSAGLIGTVECCANGRMLQVGNRNALANMTTPDPAELYPLFAQMRDLGVQDVVMEVTSHALTFDKVSPLRFDLGIFTNLTEDHLDLHGDMEGYFAEKCKLFAKSKRAVISTSTPYGQRLADTLSIPFFAVTNGETLTDVTLHADQGVEFALRQGEEAAHFFLPIPGEFSVENGALAAAACLLLGVPVQAVRGALAGFPGVRGRLERVGKHPCVFLDYAHTPDALEKLLRCVRGFAAKGQKIVLLFGCGGDRDRGKRPEMGRIASRLADFLILTSDNCRSEDPKAILRDILRGVDKEKPYTVIEDRREAIAFGISQLEKDDILILAGKGHETYEIRGRERLPFSERELVEEFLAKRERADED